MAVVVAGKRKLTYAEYELIPEDRNRHEIIDGERYVSPAPNIYHQELAARLYELLRTMFGSTGAPAWANTGSSIPTGGA